jgi:hypothetical protein
MTTRIMNSYAIFLLSLTLENSVDVTNFDPHHLEHQFSKHACCVTTRDQVAMVDKPTSNNPPPPQS